MASFGIVELERVHDPVDDAFGDAGGVSALEPNVILAGDAGERGHLLPAQPRDSSTVGAEGGEPGLLWGDPSASGGQEIANLSTHIAANIRVLVARHSSSLRTRTRVRGSL